MQPEATFGHGGLNAFVDVDELLSRLELDDKEIAWRKSFIEFDETDEKRLDDLEPLFRANQEQIAEEFYENLLQYDQAIDVIERSPKGVESLKQTQRAYLVSLATGSYDEAYFANRARIGKLHELLDMPLKQYVGQYGVYYNLIFNRLNDRIQKQVLEAIEEWAEDQHDEQGGIESVASMLGFGEKDEGPTIDEAFESTVRDAIDDGMMDLLSVLRILNLDMQIAVETYVDSYAQRLERSLEQRQKLAREVEADVQQPLDGLHEVSETTANKAEAISSHTTAQANAVNRAAGELQEISAAVEEVSAVAQSVSTQSERAEQLASAGAKSADDALDELEAIEAATERVAEAAEDLESRTDEIDRVLDQLSDLAHRTTLLATNAKVESNRTGDGTAALEIIAEEVRSFATQTKSDLSAIENAMEGVHDDVEVTIEAANDVVDRVDEGSKQVKETVGSFETVHDAARQTAAGMDEVATASNEQAESVVVTADTVEEISESANQLSAVAESLAAASEQQAATIAEIRETVVRLSDDEPEDKQPVYERIA